MITEIEQQTLDIDWFLTDGHHIGFMASGGGRLPDSVARSSENNEKLVSYFRGLPEISACTVNPELDDILTKIHGSGADERYLEDYISMTKKGLYSFDKTNFNNFLDGQYHLVAIPIKALIISDLPKDILGILKETQCSDKISDVKKLDCKSW
ncbi:hypothetical protein CEY12_20295 [Chryseobacterium sp. T16E-39]|uniref:hypothetical protein n=1 Tax=Chryseobacterium sp. T16E-39 TaxID=2015076 RepID=UPI000B5B1031|nr:hypothetical protein [Chryseobacterium sp. T16E-39]ASK32280.1 hypothetical protein CEY12_20295 [Chryseobacterium sp. T16E-39]